MLNLKNMRFATRCHRCPAPLSLHRSSTHTPPHPPPPTSPPPHITHTHAKMADASTQTQRHKKKSRRRQRRAKLKRAKEAIQELTEAEHVTHVLQHFKKYMSNVMYPDIHYIADYVTGQCCVAQRLYRGGQCCVSCNVVNQLSSISMVCILFLQDGKVLCFSKSAQQEIFQLPLNPNLGIETFDIVYYDGVIDDYCKGCTLAVTNLPIVQFHDVDGKSLATYI